MDSRHKKPGTVNRFTLITALLLSGVSLVATGVLYFRLPDLIPLHWNVLGEIDGYGPRAMAWVLGSLPLILALLMAFLPRLDPRRENYRKSARAYNAVLLAIVSLMTLLQFIVLASALGHSLRVDMLVKALVGLLFLLIGNYMGTIRSTMLFGIRTSWTLSNEEVWRRTHRLGGRLFVLAGFGFIAAAFARGVLSAVLPLTLLAVAVIVPFVYSYLLYRRINSPE